MTYKEKLLKEFYQDVTNIEIVYIQKYDKGKPNPRYKDNNKLKQFLNSREPKVLVLNEPIDMEFMNKVLSDVKDLGTILSMCRKNKELVPLFFRTNLLSHF